MKRRKILIAAALIAIVVVSFFVASNLLAPSKQAPVTPSPFYAGIETGWNATVAQCEAQIDLVKDFTNMYIIASPQVISNETRLNEVCDYAYNAGLYFMPVYYEQFFETSFGYSPAQWFTIAQQKYGKHLLGVYYYDEPGGNQLDTTEIVNGNPYITSSTPAESYIDYANYFFWLWNHGSGGGLEATSSFFRDANSSLFTSDYGLYWFDYELGYNTVFAQFGWNDSRPLQISSVRGAATAQDQNWGAIITWTYNGTQNGGEYLEPPNQIYSDMVLAYDSGATYVSIYDSSQNYVSSTLSSQDLSELKAFWNYVQQNPGKHDSLKADTAVVLPQDYGFGFRNENDSVWQYHTANSWTQKMYNDITSLLSKDGSKIDIVYGDPQFQNVIRNEYVKILYWPEDFDKGVSYPVTDLNDSLGYNTIQDALSSFATYEGTTILVLPGTYRENIEVAKPITLTSQNKNTTIILGVGGGTALSVNVDNVTATGFTIENAVNASPTLGTGILLENAHNCTLTSNIITNNYVGVFLVNSTDNAFRGNIISGNVNSIVFQDSSPNYIDASNIVNGKPYGPG